MIAGAAEVAVVSGASLLAKGGAHAGVHVEHNPLHGATSMHLVDPATAQVSKCGQVCFLGQHLGLEAAHLAGGGGSLRHGPATHNPAQGGIMRQPICIVHVLVACQPPEHGLAKLSHQRVAAILARPGIGQTLSGQVCQAEGIIEIPKRKQTSVGRHARTVELQLETVIKGDPESSIAFVTRCTVHVQPH